MKMKLTTLLFGLLLAVGWTSSAYAQNSPNNIPDAVYSAQSLANKTYTWTDAQGNDQTANYVKLNPKTQKYEGAWVKDPYQIYDLLRNIYMDPDFPGPKYSAWDASNKTQTTNSSLIPGDRKDEVYYGGIGGGWNIGVTSSSTGTLGNITIDGGTNSSYVQNAEFNSIRVLDMETGNVITEWNNSQTSFPSTWTTYNVRQSSTGFYYFYNTSSYIRIPATLLTGHTRVKVEITAWDYSSQYIGYIRINGYSNTVTAQSSAAPETIDLVYSAYSETLAADGTYTPTNEGYTALVVTVKNGLGEFPWPEPSSYLGSCSFETKKEIIDFITLTIDSVKLLTDGLRIGDADKYTTGTVFNCDGTYNKFFFLSKGQARKKSAYVKNQISSNAWPSYAGEELPFKEMFEEFSPTTGEQGDEITDFYSEMMEGHVYNVVHDCASVIQNAHQFSMSGNSGTTAYGMTGLNFFIPDYRLMLWWNPQTYNNQTYTRVDGRDFVPYEYYSTTYGWTDYRTGGVWSANYAQYNQLYAPKIGIYRITLEAEAHQCTGYNEETNPYYEVTLNWTSSLNEMSGKDVPQTYEIYEVVYDPETNTEKNVLRATVSNVTTYTFPCPPNYLQEDHSVTHTYIIKGWPTANTHPSFIAWSNQDDVVIPGLKDFLALELDHYESDFVIADQLNWYRNFLMVKNENDLKALTTVNVNTDGMNKFTLYRFLFDNQGNELAPGVKIADLTFDPIAENATRAHYKVTYDKDGYEQQKIEDYDINIAALYKEENGQQVEVHPAYNIPDAYQRATMGIPDEGDLSIRGSGDVIIWPNGLEVNFLSISVTVNNTTTTWTPATYGDNLPNGWALSPGCKWVEHNGAYYLEGMGYIMIPAAGDGNATVVIKAYGDGSSTARITVNDVQKPFLNGKANAEEKTWIVAAANRAPMRTDRANTDVTFTPSGYSSSYIREKTEGVVTINTTSGDFGYNNYIQLNGTTTISTAEGTITKIVFNGYDTYYPVSYLSTQTGTYTTSNNVGTWTGDASSVTFSSTSAAQCSSIVVTVTTGGGDDPTPANTRMIRLAIPIVDQLNASIAENTHPRRYGYVLRYEPEQGEKKESGRVIVPVQHTDSKVNGYYTLDELDNDTEIGVNHDEGIKLNVMTADVEMTLSATNTAVFYNTIQGKANELPKEYKNYETVLQRQTDGTFKEMKNPSDLFGNTYQPGEYHYWDSIPTKVTYDPAKYFGTYDGEEFKSYVPSVTTMGQNRRYYEIDSLHNTYGAPIWKTGVGKVELNSVQAQRQTNNNNSVNWTTNEGEKCSLYMLNNIDADGYLPKKNVSNVDYEPYMFRVFVESKNGNLRKYKKVEAGTGTYDGEHLEGVETSEAEKHGPICVWSAYVNLNEDAELEALNTAYGNEFSDPAEGATYDIKFHKDKVDRTGGSDANPLGEWDKDANNAMFGAIDALQTEIVNGVEKIKNDELSIFVRFYYIAKGMCPATHKPWMPSRAGEDDPGAGYGAESPGTSPSPATAVSEIRYHGEVVSTTYYNVQGIESDKPFDGVNIVVTRFSDGTTSVSKVVR